MAGKHIQKKNTSRTQPQSTAKTTARTAPRREESARSVYVVTPERASSRSQREDAYEEASRRGRKKRRGGVTWVAAVLAVMAVIVAALGITLYRANQVAQIDTIFPGVRVNGVDIGGMTASEAVAALQQTQQDPYKDAAVTVRLPLERSFTVTAQELGLSGTAGDVTALIEAAWSYGRDGTLLENLRAYRAAKRSGTDIRAEIPEELAVIDENALRRIVTEAVGEVNALLLDTSAEIGEDGITLTKGMSASKVDPEAVIGQVREAFLRQDYTEITAESVTTDAADEGISDVEFLQSIYDTIYTEPVNAMYDKDTGGVTEGVSGVSFDMEQALRLWADAQPGEQVFIPFVFTEPEVTDLSDGLFSDCLAEKTTSLSGSSSGRVTNITLAAQAMNDTVINPGETFDYNDCLGERTAARGYKEAGAYSGGKHVSELGGGICQGSSTLYYCAMVANLEITVRSCHYFVVSYLPWGMDATVSWGGPNFRFVNSRNYPIKIKAWVSNGELTVQIWGTDTDGTYARITSETWEDDEFYYAQTYRTVYAADGTELSRSKEAYSAYHKYEAAEETPEPDPTPEPTPEVTPEPTPEPTEAPTPTPEPTAPPAAEVTPEPPTPTPEPTAEPTEAPTPTPEPTAENTPEETTEQTTEPVSESTPESTETSVQEDVSEQSPESGTEDTAETDGAEQTAPEGGNE